VPGFKGSEYGRTPIRDLLHMSSVVEFLETRHGNRDLDRLWIDMVIGGLLSKKGTRQHRAVQQPDRGRYGRRCRSSLISN